MASSMRGHTVEERVYSLVDAIGPTLLHLQKVSDIERGDTKNKPSSLGGCEGKQSLHLIFLPCISRKAAYR